MPETRVLRLAVAPIHRPWRGPAPASPSAFQTNQERRFGRTVEIVQFGVNHVRLEPGD